jgi:hypothetical protein
VKRCVQYTVRISREPDGQQGERVETEEAEERFEQGGWRRREEKVRVTGSGSYQGRDRTWGFRVEMMK